MTTFYLVRRPDVQAPPSGTFGRFIVTPPRMYAVVADRATFEAWARMCGYADPECGHVHPSMERQLRDQALEGGQVAPGVQLRRDGAARLRTWPMVERQRPDTELHWLWESAVDVVQPGDPDA